ncbi:hypothetical protein DPEC_G00112330 [Dallia pectoralis]|uniref:Uncharacterized protein n=1 Tax=Dallia pectoralis TaxID=75939 RepID=A0ACC2GTE1_DALPE|nr:hypothetical protein DPEC_G00112330 [Dallia pectoralis]
MESRFPQQRRRGKGMRRERNMSIPKQQMKRAAGGEEEEKRSAKLLATSRAGVLARRRGRESVGYWQLHKEPSLSIRHRSTPLGHGSQTQHTELYFIQTVRRYYGEGHQSSLNTPISPPRPVRSGANIPGKWTYEFNRPVIILPTSHVCHVQHCTTEL